MHVNECHKVQNVFQNQHGNEKCSKVNQHRTAISWSYLIVYQNQRNTALKTNITYKRQCGWKQGHSLP